MNGKFETGFSDSHLLLDEMIAKLYSNVNTLRKAAPKAEGARFRFKLEVHEL